MESQVRQRRRVSSETLRRQSYKCSLALECAAYKKCKHGRGCRVVCPDYVPFRCARRDRSPGACNGCSSRTSCRFDKFIYEAAKADSEYRTTLIDARSGVNLTTAEAKQLASVIKPLLAQGLSPYRIVAMHPELGISEKTLYNYIEGQVFSIAGIYDIDLRRKTSRNMGKKVAKPTKNGRIGPSSRAGSMRITATMSTSICLRIRQND